MNLIAFFPNARPIYIYDSGYLCHHSSSYDSEGFIMHYGFVIVENGGAKCTLLHLNHSHIFIFFKKITIEKFHSIKIYCYMIEWMC